MNQLLNASEAGYKFSSVPIMVDNNTLNNDKGHDNTVQQNVATMERSRSWSGIDGIGGKFGEDNRLYVENELASGNKIVAEIGAGKLNASIELAKIGIGTQVIAVEPFIEPGSLEGIPENVQVVPKTVRDVKETDIPAGSVDLIVSGGYTLNYPQDKLEFISKVYHWLKNGGRAFIEYSGSLSSPSPEEIIRKFGLQEVIWLEHNESNGSSTILCIRKNDAIPVNFGKYISRLIGSGSGGPGDAVTQFNFIETANE